MRVFTKDSMDECVLIGHTDLDETNEDTVTVQDKSKIELISNVVITLGKSHTYRVETVVYQDCGQEGDTIVWSFIEERGIVLQPGDDPAYLPGWQAKE